MKNLLVALFVVSLATTALAYPGPDSIGIYMDPANGVAARTMDTAAPYEPVTLYLCVTNPSGGGVSGWEANIAVTGNTLAPEWTLTAGLDVDSSDEGFQVGIGTGSALMPNEHGAVLLAQWDALIPTTDDMVYFVISGIPGSTSFDDSPGYAKGDDAGVLIYLYPCTGGVTTPVFTINYDGSFDPWPVANEDKSFGEIKSLYR